MLLYASSVFVSAFLLFQIEPMMGRYLMPWFGGSTSVWSTLLLFFQAVLLLGYAYAFWLSRRTIRIQFRIHLLLLSLAFLTLALTAYGWNSPVFPDSSWRPHAAQWPVVALFELLLLSVGLPYFVLSTNSTLMQHWYGQFRPGQSPYPLYALSNGGSLLGLWSYPFVIEPLLSLRNQGKVWSAVFAAFLLFGACKIWKGLRKASIPEKPSDPETDIPCPVQQPRKTDYLLWIALPIVASVELLAVTSQITQEIAAIPFLWILPLSLYLISFILPFWSSRGYSRKVFVPALAIISLLYCWVLMKGPAYNFLIQILVYSLLLFSICMICHGELAMLKPHPRRLASFYLCIALGGVLGGLFVNLVAPRIFTGYWELPLGVVAVWLLLTVIHLMHGRQDLARTLSAKSAKRTYWIRTVELALMSLFLVLFAFRCIAANYSNVLFSARNFYGVLTVRQLNKDKQGQLATGLYHGATLHGYQFTAPDKTNEPTAYYDRRSGIGYAFEKLSERKRKLKVAALGQGVGTIARYGRPGDLMRFYEINPLVVAMSSNERPYFTFIRNSEAKTEFVLGDARVSLSEELARRQQHDYDLIVMDVFSSDSVPVHLLTREAFETYLQRLKSDGILAVHITNRCLNLLPVVQRQAEHHKLHLLLMDRKGDGTSALNSRWILLTREAGILERSAIPEFPQSPIPFYGGQPLWTDEYSNVFQIVVSLWQWYS